MDGRPRKGEVGEPIKPWRIGKEEVRRGDFAEDRSAGCRREDREFGAMIGVEATMMENGRLMQVSDAGQPLDLAGAHIVPEPGCKDLN